MQLSNPLIRNLEEGSGDEMSHLYPDRGIMSKESPLDRLEQDILDESISTTKLLRLFIVIGGRAFSEPLRKWAMNELRGYNGPSEEIPDYRTIGAPIQADSRSPFWQARAETISALDLPEIARETISQEIPVRFSVAKIQSLLDGRNSTEPIKLSLPGGPELCRLMSYEPGRREQQVIVESLYWAVHTASLQDILEQARNRLLDFTAELRSSMTPGLEDPTVEQVHTAVQSINITVGDNSPVTLTAPITNERKDMPVRIPLISRGFFKR
ncbi:hypothetical protein ABT185_27470 [Streptomyces clavifer]|uniref:AbiTii domain-containing protein n=1 Tax=Streptomyces clavifer TaxID=68188 RepID=UPI00332749D3